MSDNISLSGTSEFYDITQGVPQRFTEQTSNSNTFLIQKGQLNKYRLRPAIINEHAESSRNIQGVVNSTQQVGQIVRVSQDNINGLLLTLESASFAEVDNFESYANDTALQAVWVPSGDLNVLNTVIVKGGTQSMELPMQNNNDQWTSTIPAADLSGYTASLDVYFEDTFTNMQLSMVLGDGVNTKTFTLVQNNINEWINFDVNEEAFIEDGGTPVDMTAVTQLAFKVTKRKNNRHVYIDNIQHSPPPGQIGVEFWDLGNVTPVSGVTSLTDGTQYTQLGDLGIDSAGVSASKTISLQGGKRLYTVKDFVAGAALEIPSNELLTVDNYYAIVLTYIDTPVNVYGPNNAYNISYYNSGYAFTTPNNSTPITQIGTYNDLMFGIFSTADVYVNTLLTFYDAAPGSGSSVNVFIEDKDMKITNILSGENQPQQSLLAEFRDRAFNMTKGSKFEIYHNDDFADDITTNTLLFGYIYERMESNG